MNHLGSVVNEIHVLKFSKVKIYVLGARNSEFFSNPEIYELLDGPTELTEAFIRITVKSCKQTFENQKRKDLTNSMKSPRE